MRGKAGAPRRVLWLFGITPACAGKRSVALKFVKILKDHPRVCGEKHLITSLFAMTIGSPPRVRGKAAHRSAWGCKPWITPACAGKSDAEIVVHSPLEDHPRVCGEKGRCHKGQLTQLGSPPRVRGKVQALIAASNESRITPACAGKR